MYACGARGTSFLRIRVFLPHPGFQPGLKECRVQDPRRSLESAILNSEFSW